MAIVQATDRWQLGAVQGERAVFAVARSGEGTRYALDGIDVLTAGPLDFLIVENGRMANLPRNVETGYMLGRSILFLDPPIPLCTGESLGVIASRLSRQALPLIDRQAACREFRVTVWDKASNQASAPLPMSYGSRSRERVVARLAFGFAGVAVDDCVTPEGLRRAPDGEPLMFLSLMVPDDRAGLFQAKAMAMARFAGAAGLSIKVTGPHLLESFAWACDLHHDAPRAVQKLDIGA